MLYQTKTQTQRLEKLLEGIDIPRSYYERAVDRYKSLSEWFCREQSEIAQYEPVVYIQGSFRLGLVNRPLHAREEYDLDVVCELRLLAKSGITQKELKEMVGREVKTYAKAHAMSEPPTESKRCWRLDYADEVRFHIDNLPCVHEDIEIIVRLVESGVEVQLAQKAIALTCTEHPEYELLTASWPMSNPAGFGIWFEGRFGSVGQRRRQLLVEAREYKSIEAVPTFALKTPLQQAIQLLKRHRDFMFANRPDLKPISMLITTLAALAYQGEEDLAEALTGILDRMPQFVNEQKPMVPNPVNPGEDFADKWSSVPGLEDNFWNWLDRARRDFERLLSSDDSDEVRSLAESKFGVRLPESPAQAPAVLTGTRRSAPLIVVKDAPRPWGSHERPKKRSL